eukprot:Colp12_sorted_trinity150504_noHs@13767
MASYEGLARRSKYQKRPFILSRAFFAGTQRYGAVWTGDNMAQWSHLEISIPMLLSISIAGLPFVGADVGGFFNNPEPELLVRWYQMGSCQPFFRAHAHLDTKRREPWLFEKQDMALMRAAIVERYTYLPYWYSLFYTASVTGVPPMRPLWAEFPEDAETFGVDDAFMVGPHILAHPVSAKGVSSVSVYLPGAESWVSVHTGEVYEGGKRHSIPVTMETVPIFQRGGSIVPRKMRPRRASSLMANDPYTLVVVLDAKGEARGQLYVDDGDSFEYQKGAYSHIAYEFKNNCLASTPSATGFTNKAWLERVIVHQAASVDSVTLTTANGNRTSLSFQVDRDHVTIKKPEVNIVSDFKICLTRK